MSLNSSFDQLRLSEAEESNCQDPEVTSLKSPEANDQKTMPLSNGFHHQEQSHSMEDLVSSTNGSLMNVQNQNAHQSSYLPWHDYFMSLCFLTAARSKDPNTKVGACIVDKENRVLSLGYNGMPRGIKDDDLPWGKVGEHAYDTKYPYVCHAEMNAIINERHAALDECSIYVSKFPCCECAKLIIQAGIRSVVFAEVKPEPMEEQVPSRKMFSLAGVTCKKFIPSIHHLSLIMVDGIGSVSITK